MKLKRIIKVVKSFSKNKIFFYFWVLYFIFLLAVSTLACYFAYQQKNEELHAQMNIVMSGLSADYRGFVSNFWQVYMPIFERNSSLHNIFLNYYVNSVDRDLLPLEKNDLSYALQQMLLRDNRAEWIAIYSKDRDTNYIFYSGEKSLQPLPSNFPYRTQLENRKAGMEVYGMETMPTNGISGNTFAISGGTPYNIGNGAIVVGYSTSSLKQIYENNYSPINSLNYYILSGNELVFKADAQYDEKPEYIPLKEYRGLVKSNSGKRLFVDVITCGSKTTFLVCTTSWNEMLWYLHSNTLSILFIVVVFAFFSIAIYLFMMRLISREVNTIRKGLNWLGENHLDYRIPTDFRQSGLPEIADSINHMATRLKENINRAYFYELKQKEAELSELQSKFNPHFLYNTLEMLRSRCYQNGDESTADIITQLSSIFRGFIGSRTFIPLKEELSASKRYLSLFGARYGDRVRIFYDFETELLQYGIIRNVFQPLIENYYVHGFDSAEEENYILFSGKSLDERFMVITIEDNGLGMSDYEIDELNIRLSEPVQLDTESYGLKNLHQRLYLFYGDECGLTIHKNGKKGLLIQMQLQKLRCEDYENRKHQ